ncbi:autoinducer binding domain-containing protein [Burkholderia cenocepacia]|uniref:autoinducer binding domain-containing protein n=1 Tax=Burkholderia cenocepacia TaxID=95486 RepID=UPI002AB7F2AD|nr:autoinducer binding domain-containing protein [Burkholderia cenocepacia]
MQPSLLNWWHDVRSEMARVRTEELVFSTIASRGRALGFTYYAYGLKALAHLSRPQIRMYSSYPRQWSERYKDRDYVSIDPTVKVARATREMVVWSDRLFSPAALLWREARDHGLRTGLSQPSWVDKGTFALLSVSRDSPPVSESEAEAIRPYLILLAETASVTLGGIASASAKDRSQLTRREVEVLKWSAEGKTAYETAILLGITEVTVNFHVQNALKKLGVASKIQAVALAVSDGLLES